MSELVYLDRDTVAALRSPTRMRILAAAERPSTAGQLADALGAPVTRLYHHLDRLIRIGLLGVVDEMKDGAAVTRVFQTVVSDLRARVDLDSLGTAMLDAAVDLRAAEAGARTLAGRTFGPLPATAVDRIIAAVEQVIADMDAANDPDGQLYGFTYLVAPVRPIEQPDYHVRSGTDADLPTFQRVLYEAIAWHPERARPPMAQVLAHPQLVIFHEGWGRPGDFGVVATRDGEPVGAAFARLFTDEVHSSGYVDPQTPEIAIAVWPEHRGRGVGARLLTALAARAARRGVGRLSLSVERSNPAARLYQRCGYRILGEPGDDYLMVTDLTYQRGNA